ncbi:hypothetical protein [Streptomyces sp. NPDC001415]
MVVAAVNPEWNPAALGWTVDWQRHHIGLKTLLDDGTQLTGIVPGATWHGDGIGRWPTRQQRDFARLNPEQQKRLGELGVQPAVQARKAPAPGGEKTGAGRGEQAFTRGLAAPDVTTHPNPQTDPAQPPATVPAPQPAAPEPTPAEASLLRLVQGVLTGLIILTLLFALYVLNEHPTVLPAIAGVGTLVAIGAAIVGVVKFTNRQRP